MRVTRVLVIGCLLALLAPLAATAATADAIRLTPTSAKFPERSFIVTLPKDVDISRAAIHVTENGNPVPQVAVTPTSDLEGKQVGTVLVIDASNSMRGAPMSAAIEAARQFAAQRYANQPLAIVTFNSESRVRLPFTSDASKIRKALADAPAIAPETHLYDGIERALDLIARAKKSSVSIVVLSDGADTGSTSVPTSVITRAQQQNVRLFTVGLTTSRQFDPSPLQQLARETNATFSSATSPGDLAPIFDELGYRLANEYLVQYRSFAGPNEKVQVQVSFDGLEGSAVGEYRSPKLAATIQPPPPFEPSILDRVMQSPLTMLLLVLVVAGLLAFIGSTLIRPKASDLRDRLGSFVSVGTNKDGKRQTAMLSERLLAGTEASFRKTQWWTRFKDTLEIAEIRIPAEQIIILTLIGTLLLMWLLSVFFNLAAAFLALLAPLAVRSFIKFRAERQRRAFGEQLPDNLQVLASALRAGHSLVGALSVVVDDAPEPSRREFRRVVADEQLGVPLEDAVRAIAERMHNRDLEQVALVAALQRETGANSAEVLDRISDTVRERAALRRLVRTLTAQGRMARWIVSALPVALLLVISVLNSRYMTPMYTRTAGQILLAFAAIMVISGSLVIRKIVNIRI
jgi:tight adherence protein B